MKLKWFDELEEAKELVSRLRPGELGCLYLGVQGNPVTPDPKNDQFRVVARHHGGISGAWPALTQPGFHTSSKSSTAGSMALTIGNLLDDLLYPRKSKHLLLNSLGRTEVGRPARGMTGFPVP